MGFSTVLHFHKKICAKHFHNIAPLLLLLPQFKWNYWIKAYGFLHGS